jgi:hypothetical protein
MARYTAEEQAAIAAARGARTTPRTGKGGLAESPEYMRAYELSQQTGVKYWPGAEGEPEPVAGGTIPVVQTPEAAAVIEQAYARGVLQKEGVPVVAPTTTITPTAGGVTVGYPYSTINGVPTSLSLTPYTVGGQPQFFGGIVKGALFWTVGMLKELLAKWGPTLLKSIIGAAAFKEFMDLLFGGAGDETILRSKPGARRGKRYSIGANPRLNTLLKVAKRVDNIFVRYDTRISKFRSRIRGTRRRRVYRAAPSAFLSPVERKLLAKGG